MRYDEIRAHVERVLRKEFEHRFAEIGEKGPRDTYTPDRFDAARTILAVGAEAYWKRLGEEGERVWLRNCHDQMKPMIRSEYTRKITDGDFVKIYLIMKTQ